eukprot:210623-Chlamydomonas_euryale.AAC.1
MHTMRTGAPACRRVVDPACARPHLERELDVGDVAQLLPHPRLRPLLLQHLQVLEHERDRRQAKSRAGGEAGVGERDGRREEMARGVLAVAVPVDAGAQVGRPAEALRVAEEGRSGCGCSAW